MAARVYRTKKSASWYVSWTEDGLRKCRSTGPGEDGKARAHSLKDRIDAAQAAVEPDLIVQHVPKRAAEG